MKIWNNVLITGASSGIGLAFAGNIAGNCNNLIIVSRNQFKLNKIKEDLENEHKIRAWVIDCDLTALDSVKEIINFIESNDIIPDLFINNAGIGVYGKFNETVQDRIQEIINLNILSSTLLIKEIAQLMNRKNGGTILNVSSTIAFRKSLGWSVYAASKAYILSLSKSLAIEYKKSNLKISVLCPGKTDTDFDFNSGYKSNSAKTKMTPEYVAKYTMKKLVKGKEVIIPGFTNKLKYYLFKFLPEFITDMIVKSI
ncbi:MAG: SDR family NAD(P)-dependent oxidoreductase [Bacteroidetes bacterium]|nr:SDR family NAD(P)-dependent oxidoreductase [Bacteroidota bacterium]